MYFSCDDILNNDLITKYIMNDMSSDERKALEMHVANCHECRDDLAMTFSFYKEIETVESQSFSEFETDMTQALLNKENQNFIQKIIEYFVDQWHKFSFELKMKLGRIRHRSQTSLVPVPIRSSEHQIPVRSRNILEFDDLNVEWDDEKDDEGCYLKISRKMNLSSARITLKNKNGGIISSEPLDYEPVYFENIEPGSYSIQLDYDGHNQKKYNIKI